MGAATLRLREALQEAIAEHAGDAGQVRAAQTDYSRQIVELAAELLDVLSSGSGEDTEDSPGRRAATRAGFEPDEPRDGQAEMTPGQRAAQRARPRRRGGIFD